MVKSEVFYFPKGFTVRKILEFVRLNSTFESEIYLLKNNGKYNAKSVLGIMGVFLTASIGDKFIVQATGNDANEAMAKIKEFTNHKESAMLLSMWDEEGIENVDKALATSKRRWTPEVRGIAKSYLTMNNNS
ncbi:HPr family phosphocarrier protein [Anaerobacillus sp. MEB173]|uniref:HPr family phosphocarrier protein n=1 Tax=Anaerobacillus sp. MEB173 TaxID=3383345 RepID=UPI003F927E7A